VCSYWRKCLVNNLHYHQVTVTPHELTCLHNVLSRVRCELSQKREKWLETRDTKHELTDSEWMLECQAKDLERWLSYCNQSLYKTWSELPDGDHLKHSYSDSVWTWDDQDLCNIPEENRVSPEELKEIARDLKVDRPKRPKRRKRRKD
jgi:hypothetical protein